MARFDVMVIGGGTGNNTASAAARAGHETLLVEKGRLGGTCLNRGCNPSKMLIQGANAANAVREAGRFHVDASLEGVNTAALVGETTDTLFGIAEGMAAGKREEANLTLRQAEATFVDDRTVTVDDELHTAERVVIATGSRPLVPEAIDGLQETAYLTSTDALRLETPPDRLVILGGGYIAAELGYYFDALGTDVAIVEMMDTLVPREDDEVAAAFTEIARDRHDVYTGHRVTAVERVGDRLVTHTEDADGVPTTILGDDLLVALGRRPNTDGLGLESTGVATDDRGFVETNEYLETTAERVWAQGDVAGNHMFKHSGDYETEVLIDNVAHDRRRAVDYTGMPHAVFTEPQIAGVGATEAQLQEAGREYVVGRQAFPDEPMGRALKLDHGFAKVLADPDTGDLLGCHVLGHEASMLVHEAVIGIRNDLTAEDLAESIHVHPAMSKVMVNAFADAAAQV